MTPQTQTPNQELQSDTATFQVILKGLQPGESPSEAKQKLAVLFKTSLEQVDALLSSSNFVVKKGISFDLASSYKGSIEAAGGACELLPERDVLALDIDLPTPDAFAAKTAASPPNSGSAVAGSPAGGNALKTGIENLDVLKHKISKNTAYLGVLVGMGIFAFSFFLSWACVPAGQMARDGGSVTGWNEKAYLALLPLAFALYPVFLQKSVQLKNLLVNIVIAFVLLGYNNVANKTTWTNHYGNMGSTLDVGFWIGFVAMLTISACGIAWSLHTTDNDEVQ
ncbi:hypothetical protein [Undibacterium sp.]|uniref:hypothetical protein n=1 Tax=Undibacterium sp. TaxID=1914977 RepID=UPI002731699F|nr:hypothetical protein [Undibacterium sp.]MDP1977629.1 hypothetical protein [Undibacterium sp.]